MDISQIPIEILENIFKYIEKENKIELVCKLWNQICLNPNLNKIRIKCLCNLSLPTNYSKNCNSKTHNCICDISPKYAYYCKSNKHKCICNKNNLLNIYQCKSNNCICVCNLGIIYSKNCNSKTHY